MGANSAKYRPLSDLGTLSHGLSSTSADHWDSALLRFLSHSTLHLSPLDLTFALCRRSLEFELDVRQLQRNDGNVDDTYLLGIPP
jgi:hypothetical protein